MAVAIVLAIAAAVLLPQYGDYAVRASVAEGIASLQPYRDQVAAALQEKRPLPQPDPKQFYKTVRSVRVGPTGELRITFQGHRSIDGRSIVQVPMVGGGMVHAWACYNIDMPEHELSVACREKRGGGKLIKKTKLGPGPAGRLLQAHVNGEGALDV